MPVSIKISKVADRTRELDVAGVEIKFGRLRGYPLGLVVKED